MTETKLVSLTIDGVQVQVPPGTLVVDAAKKAGVDIPVFCYHPKMEPVGMCRMCLVEIGRPVIDRSTGQPALEEDGSLQIQFGRNLETACTAPVSEGMVVLGMTEKAKAGREDILELLLTSHPLDCPVCDKGGECPLQNLTMGYGPGESRFIFDEKIKLDKHVPLGELIFLDRERCIQCARCIRFQQDIAADPVIEFFHRGRTTEIVTYSEPGFDSYWSGNTTDICPVGALTTADFRFGARIWELSSAASVCTHCPVGCNLTLNLRREAGSGGKTVIKRIMPRQNEYVNELWICDKGRFAHHFAAPTVERLVEPLVRRDGELQPATWEEALNLVAERFSAAGSGLLTLAGGRLSNEDFFNLGELTAGFGGQRALYTHMGGGQLTTQIGMAPGSNLGDLGAQDVVLVVASDLEEEAPLWWLRLRGAALRGAQVITVNPRSTKLDQDAHYALRYPFGSATSAVLALARALGQDVPDLTETARSMADSLDFKAAAKALREAQNVVVLYGSEGSGVEGSQTLAEACAKLLSESGHVGKPNNGLIGVWPRANEQGAYESGWDALPDQLAALDAAGVLYISAADPVGDDPAYQAAFGAGTFVVVQDLFLTQTARLADVVLPAQSWVEREGSFTNGERRVQRYYPALSATTALPQRAESPGYSRSSLLTNRATVVGPLADFTIAAMIGERTGIDLASVSAAAVMLRMAKTLPQFAGISYQKLAQVEEQWPIVGREDLYYGGTGYENSQGLGVQLSLAKAARYSWPRIADFKLPKLGLIAFPITRLYDRGATLLPSQLLHERISEPYVVLNAADAGRLHVGQGALVRLVFSEQGDGVVLPAHLDASLPERVALLPRSFDIPLDGPRAVEVRLAERVKT